MYTTIRKASDKDAEPVKLAELFIMPDSPVLEAVKKLNDNNEKILLVTDSNSRLLGTITDGDIRRAMLRTPNFMEIKAREVMHKKPITLKAGYSVEEANWLMEKNKIFHVPVVDDEGRVTDLAVWDKITHPITYTNPVVIMAGGMGKRLRPITENIPKPLVPVGGKPILETIMCRLVKQGFTNICLSVNYKAEMIKEYFGCGREFGVSINYVEEEKQLGTAGSLGLIEQQFNEPMIVMNSDLLTKVDLKQMLDFHVNSGSIATMGVRKHSYDVPFGVVDIENNVIKNIVEKPTQYFFVNAGMYILEPAALSHVNRNEYLDMPSLFTRLAQEGHLTSAFMVHEYWLDIGRSDELEKAEKEFSEHFA